MTQTSPVPHDGYAHTITGLLRRREEMMQEIGETRERLAVLSNDVESLDRVLETLGYQGDVKLTPRIPRVVLFYRGELRQWLRKRLEEAGPQTSRQMAEALVQAEGKDARDRRMMNDIVKRMGKALRQMQDVGIVTRSPKRVHGEFIWDAVAVLSATRTSRDVENMDQRLVDLRASLPT